VDIPGLTSPAACRTLAELAAAVPADQAVVEIGVFRGRSLCALAAGAAAGHGARVWGVDPWDLPGNEPPAYRGGSKRTRAARATFNAAATREAAGEAVAAAGLSDRVTLVRGFSTAVAAGWAGPPVGLLHVDGDHTAAGRDVAAWWPHVAEDAVIAVDDYSARFPAVVRDVDALAAGGMALQVRHGRLAILRRPA